MCREKIPLGYAVEGRAAQIDKITRFQEREVRWAMFRERAQKFPSLRTWKSFVRRKQFRKGLVGTRNTTGHVTIRLRPNLYIFALVSPSNVEIVGQLESTALKLVVSLVLRMPKDILCVNPTPKSSNQPLFMSPPSRPGSSEPIAIT